MGGKKNLADILKSVQSHSPDIVVLPEFRNNLTGEQIKTTLSKLGLKHQTVPNAPSIVNTVLIASRYEGFEFPEAEVPINLKHLVAVMKLKDFFLVGMFCADKIIAKNFLTYLCEFRHRFQDFPVIATGDFNLGAQGSNINHYNQLNILIENGWIDVWKRDNASKNYEWCCRTSSGVSQPDHIFATPDIASFIKSPRYSQYELTAGFSDHAPMLAELKIEN